MGMRATEQRNGGLHEDIEGEAEEGNADQSQCSPLSLLATGARQLPDDNDGGNNFDQGIEAETREGDRARAQRGDDDNDATDDIPAEGSILQTYPPTNQGSSRFF